MSRNIYRKAHRTGLVSADIFRPGVISLAELGNLTPNDIWDGTLIHVRDDNSIYAYSLESIAVADGLNIITPTTGVGRWLKIGFGGTATPTSGTADKWVDVTKITSGEIVTVDKSSGADWPQEVRRNVIDVEGILDVVDGYVLTGDENPSGTGMVFQETSAGPPIQPNEGVLFVSDGTGGRTDNHLYYLDDGGTSTDLLLVGTGTTAITQTNAIYVSKAGSDASSGLTKDDPKLTIGSAITAANTLAPSASNRVTIHIQDAGIYDEQVVVPSYVSLLGPNATVTGTAISVVEPGTQSRIVLHRIVATGTGAVGLGMSAGDGPCWVDVDEVTCEATGNPAVSNTATNTCYLKIRRIIHTGGGAGLSAASTSDLVLEVGEIEVATGIGFAVGGASVTVSGFIGKITDTGAGIGIDVDASAMGKVDLVVGLIDCTTTYTVDPNNTLNLLVGDLVGAVGTVTGTANVTEAGVPAVVASDREHINMPEAPANIVQYVGWAPRDCTLVKVKVYNHTVNSVGTYTLSVTKTSGVTTTDILSAATYDMTLLSPATVTTMSLTATPADLEFLEDDVWTISLDSSDAGMNATGIYIDLIFEVY
jgi:hypothetical protein